MDVTRPRNGDDVIADDLRRLTRQDDRAIAKRYGFEPHPDFSLASNVLDPPGTHPSEQQLEFGKDGKPFFIAGPYDDAHAIVTKLARTAGEGNFHYMVSWGDIGAFDDFEDLWEE